MRLLHQTLGFGALLSRAVCAGWMKNYLNAVFSGIDVCTSETLCNYSHNEHHDARPFIHQYTALV